MESELLNGFNDDDYCMKYDFETTYWPEVNNRLDLQLTETLNGILPISPTEVNKNYFENDPTSSSSDFDLNNDIQNNNFSFIRNKSENFEVDFSLMNGSTSPTIEVISIDPNYGFDDSTEILESSDFNNIIEEYNESSTDNDDDDDEREEDNVNNDNNCIYYQQENESSSIDEYESYSSNDDDEENYEKIENTNNKDNNYSNYTIKHDKENENNNFVIENNTNIFDLKNFDLTKFITQDDDYNVIIENNESHQNYDEDSDVDVDVETIECKINSNNVDILKQNSTIKSNMAINQQIEDDLIKDPSWSPSSESKKLNKNINENKRSKIKNQITNNTINNKMKPIPNNNNNNVNEKSSEIILERKIYGLGRGGKNISMCSKEQNDFKKQTKSTNSILIDENIKVVTENSKKSEIMNSNNKSVITNQSLNSKIIKTEPDQLHLDGQEIINSSIDLENISNKNANKIISNDHDYYNKTILPLPSVKKKLNLEEYKKRRGVGSAGGDVLNIAKPKITPITVTPTTTTTKNQSSPNNKIDEELKTVAKKLSIPTQQSIKSISTANSNQIITPAKKMILEKLEKNSIDPITEAKNKVLRLKELKKKAALDRIIDSTVSAKVGPITKILPLAEIVKCNKNSNEEKQNNHKKSNLNEYEEIIIVSVSLNTDLSIPPEFHRIENNTEKKRNGLNGSASLFYNISDTLNKANAVENIKISSCSLISSIQDIALKKLNATPDINQIACSTTNNQVIKKQSDNSSTSVEGEEHGEDKIIMHLPKNRVRLPKQSIGTQTLMLPQFPPLTLLFKTVEKKRRRSYRSRRRSTSYSSQDDDYYNNSNDHSYQNLNSHHHSRSTSRKRSRRNNRIDDDKNFITSKRLTRHRSKSNDSLSSSSSLSSESGIDRRGRSRERRKRKYSSTSPGNSNSSSRSSTSSSHSMTSRSTSNRSSCSRTSMSSSSLSRSRSSSKSRSKHYKNHKSKLKSRYKKRHNQKRDVSPAVEERRIVYVGRIEQETSKDDLKRKFITYGPIRQITLHYKDTGMKYGFVTFERAQDAFKAIDNGLKDSKINMYDISFGGRRQFCGASYSDLDGAATNSLQMCSYPSMTQSQKKDDSFEALLAKVKEKLNNKKSSSSSSSLLSPSSLNNNNSVRRNKI